MNVRLTVNGSVHDVDVGPDTSLLRVLRGQLGLTGAKEACGTGDCGACTVLCAGRAVTSCVLLAGLVDAPVTTVEGLGDLGVVLGRAFGAAGGFQCGFCTPGQVVRAAALLAEGLPDDDAELRRLLSGNLCRCTGYQGIVDALRAAAAAGAGPSTVAAPHITEANRRSIT